MESHQTEAGQYHLIEKIAQGGMAEIFRGKAVDAHGFEKPIVIKRILPQIAASPEFVDMLVDEAKIAVQLNHGNIAQIYDLGKVADDYFIVMEYVDGKTLSQIMKRLRTLNKRMPIPYLLWICAEIAQGLDYMHRKTDEQGLPLHIVHRDISPQNIILSTSGTIKIIDFGIAKAKTKVSTTDSGVLKGKFAYMSPEHAEGGKLDYRTDIFSLGVILFELLTGQRLFKGKNNEETLRKVRKVRIPRPSSLREMVTEELDEMTLRPLQRDRDKRVQSAEEFSHQLTRYRIQHYPDFSPSELIAYLIDLFPEISPAKVTEKPPEVITETKGEAASESGQPERTVAASSEAVKKMLKKGEVYSPPMPEPLPPQPEEQKKRDWRPLFKIGRQSAPWIAVLFLIWGLTHSLPLLKKTVSFVESWTKQSDAPDLPQSPPPTPPLEVKKGIVERLVRIESEPSGATVFLNDQKTEWKTPAAIPLRIARAYKVGLYLEQHQFWEKRVQIAAEEPENIQATLSLNYGDLIIESLPSEAEVYLNGAAVGMTPFTLNSIPPNTLYTIELRREGYETWNREIKVFGGKRELITASLKKIPKKKTLR